MGTLICGWRWSAVGMSFPRSHHGWSSKLRCLNWREQNRFKSADSWKAIPKSCSSWWLMISLSRGPLPSATITAYSRRSFCHRASSATALWMVQRWARRPLSSTSLGSVSQWSTHTGTVGSSGADFSSRLPGVALGWLRHSSRPSTQFPIT